MNHRVALVLLAIELRPGPHQPARQLFSLVPPLDLSALLTVALFVTRLVRGLALGVDQEWIEWSSALALALASVVWTIIDLLFFAGGNRNYGTVWT